MSRYKERMIEKFGKKRVTEINKLRSKMFYQLKNDIKTFLKNQIKKRGAKPISENIMGLSVQHANLLDRKYKNKTIEERIISKRRAKRYAEVELRRFINEFYPYETHEYKDYLKSKKWKLIREKVIEERGAKCERCGSEKYLQVHHRHYRNLFNEDLDDLELLCNSCHLKEHGLK